MKSGRIAVAGAGIAGLTAAQSLARGKLLARAMLGEKMLTASHA